jgi:hypothetical protein
LTSDQLARRDPPSRPAWLRLDSDAIVHRATELAPRLMAFGEHRGSAPVRSR